MNNKNKLILGGAFLASATLLVGCDQLFPSSDTQFPSSIIISSSQNSSSINEKISLELTMSDLTVTYDGQLHSISINETLPEGVNITYRGNGKTNVGEYEVIATIKDTTGKYLVPSELKAKLCIVKADNTFELKDVTAQYQQDWEIEYDSKVDGQLSVKYLDADGKTIEKPTEIGTYTIVGVLDAGDNYNIANDTATLTITKADVNDIKFESKTVSYNGSVQDLFIEGDLPEGVTVSYSGNGNINVGSYEVIATFTDTTGKYVVPQPMKATLTIEKAELTGITFVDAGFEYDENEHSIYIGGNLPEGVTVEYSGNGKSEIGDYEVIATFTDTTGNYVVPQPMKATMSIYNDGDYAVVKFNFGDRSETYLILKDSYIKNIPSVPEKLGYEGSWDYDLISNKVYRDLEISIIYSKVEYEIKYNLPEGLENASNNPSSYDVESNVELVTPEEKNGYYFLGWYLDEEYSNKVEQIEVGTTGDIELYAKYISIGIENCGDFEIENSSEQRYVGGYVSYEVDSFNLKDILSVTEGCYYEVYTDFNGEYSVDVENLSLNHGDNIYYIRVYLDETRYVTYLLEVERESKKVVTISHDDKTLLTMEVEPGTTIDLSQLPTVEEKPGFEFKGWGLIRNDEEIITFPYTVTSDITLYSIYSPREFTIYYDLGYGLDIVEAKATFLEKVDLYIPEMYGHVFKGWSYQGQLIEPGSEYTYVIPGHLQLTAVWEELEKYEISFEENKGSEVDDIIKCEGEYITSLNEPTRENYKFEGWYYDEYRTEKVTLPIEVNEDLVLYANYEIIDYTQVEAEITFYSTMGHILESNFQNHLEEFKKQYPNIKINHVIIGGYELLKNTVVNELSIGCGPDIVYAYGEHADIYSETGKLNSLDKFINNDKYGLTQSQIDDFIAGIYDQGNIEEEMCLLPFSRSTEIMFYNKTVFNQLNLEVPTHWFSEDENDTTSMEYACKVLKEVYPSSKPLGYDFDYQYFITQCEQLGIPYYNEENEYDINTSEHKAIVDKLQEWYRKGWVTTNNIYGTYCSELFISDMEYSKAYIVIGPNAGAQYYLPSYIDSDYSFDVGMAPIPQHDENNKKAFSSGVSLCSFANADQDKELASWLLMKFMTTNVEYQAEHSIYSNYLPAIKSATETDIYKKYLADANDETIDLQDRLNGLGMIAALEQFDYVYSTKADLRDTLLQEQISNGITNTLLTDGDAQDWLDSVEEILNKEIYTNNEKDVLSRAFKIIYESAKEFNGADYKNDIALNKWIYIGTEKVDISWDIQYVGLEKSFDINDSHCDLLIIENNAYYISLEEATNLILTPTISYKEQTMSLNDFDSSCSISFKIPELILNSVEDWDKNDRSVISIKGTVVEKVANGTNAGSLYIIDEEGNGYYVYRPNTSGARIGDVIVVTGIRSDYAGQEEFAKGATYIIIENGNYDAIEFKDVTDAWEKADNPNIMGDLGNDYQNILVKLSDCTPQYIDGNSYYFTIGDGINMYCIHNNQYFVDTVTNDKWIDCFNEALQLGKKINIEGVAVVYNKNYQIYISSNSENSISLAGDITIDEKFDRIQSILWDYSDNQYYDKNTIVTIDTPAFASIEYSLFAADPYYTVSLEDGVFHVQPNEIAVNNVILATVTIDGETREIYFQINTLSAGYNGYKAYVTAQELVTPDVSSHIVNVYLKEYSTENQITVQINVNNLYLAYEAVYFGKNVDADTLTISAPEGYIISDIKIEQYSKYSNFSFYKGEFESGKIIDYMLTESLIELSPNCRVVTMGNTSGYNASFYNIEITVIEDVSNAISINKTISEIALEHNWENEANYTSVDLDNNIRLETSANIETNSGKYYMSNQSWRLYAKDNPSLLIRPMNGCEFYKITITYESVLDSMLMFEDGNKCYSGVSYYVSSSVLLYVLYGENSESGSVQITAIEIEYSLTETL